MDNRKKYGLQLRGPTASGAAKPLPAARKPSIFQDGDLDDEDDVERAISRQAAKNRALKEVEQQHKAALEEDPSIFDYDGVYEEIKGTAGRNKKNLQEQKKPKYITALVDKAKARQQEQEIVYERKLLKERQQEDHLYGDKEKFVTAAYKMKLAERDKWLEEDRQRQLQEAAEEVTKKEDISDFYRNLLSKNMAFGAGDNKYNKEAPDPAASAHRGKEEPRPVEGMNASTPEVSQDAKSQKMEDSQKDEGNTSLLSIQQGAHVEDASNGQDVKGNTIVSSNPQTSEEFAKDKETIPSKESDRKLTEDALVAAKERYLARKRLRT